MALRWLLSRTVRRATDLCRQVERLINEQRDLLSPEAVSKVSGGVVELRQIIRSGPPREQLEKGMEQLEKVANQWLKPYPNANIRENVKEIAVAVVVIFGITTFFLQLTKIPTGSMQPTLYGITHEDLKDDPKAELPGVFKRIYLLAVKGVRYYHEVAEEPGVFEGFRYERPRTIFPLVKMQQIILRPLDGSGRPSRERVYTVWFPPDRFEERTGLRKGDRFQAGEDIIKMKVTSGDHLLVDRFTYNFRRPRRGEIIVFKTRGITKRFGPDGSMLAQDQLYIKRLVALPNERVRIGNDQHLIINGRRLDASDRHFENVYTFSPEYRENHYFGHANQAVANRFPYAPSIAPLFKDETVEYKVGPHHYLAMGDNTMNSLDSRSWGDLPQKNVIGKCFFVYWPITERFGWGYR